MNYRRRKRRRWNIITADIRRNKLKE